MLTDGPGRELVVSGADVLAAGIGAVVVFDDGSAVPVTGGSIRIPVPDGVRSGQLVIGRRDYLASHAGTLPTDFVLEQNYPNPFNPTTTIRFSLPVAAEVELAIFNLLGQRVTTLVEGLRAAGRYTVVWDGRDDAGRPVASGVYFYRLQTDGFRETRKMLLVK